MWRVSILLLCATSVLAQQPPRLNYQQQKDFDDAVGYLDTVTAAIEELDKQTVNVKVGDASVPIQDIDQWIGKKDSAARYLGFADARFKKLPADHPLIKPELERSAKLHKFIDVLDKRLKTLRDPVMKVVEQGGGEAYKADFDRLKEINLMFNNPGILNNQPEVAIEVIKQMEPMKAERQRIAAKYADLLKQDTPASKDMNNVLRNSDAVFQNFQITADNYATTAPKQINQWLNEAIRIGQDSARDKKYLYFGENGGVNNLIKRAQTKLLVLSALRPDAPETKTAAAQINATRDQIKGMQASLLEGIVQSNTMPSESYNGGDKAELIERVKKKWSESGVSAPVLKSGINSQEWQRSTRWEWNRSDAWEKVDKSRIQGFVIVKQSDTIAVVHYVNLVKDHLANDQISAYFLNDPAQEPEVVYKVLVAKVK